MKLLMLRGPVPRDRNPDEIKYGSLEKSTDIYEHMAYHLGDEACEIVYHGRKGYEAQYSERCRVTWVRDLKRYNAPFDPDVIWLRGGFPEYYRFIKKFPKAFILWYGANHQKIKAGKNISLVLCDSQSQLKKARKQGYKADLWWKPFPPNFTEIRRPKKYHCLFVACNPNDERKRVRWFYRHLPKDIKVLQLGFRPKFKVPKNVIVKRVERHKMPKAISKCYCTAVPYTGEDANPRIIAESLACNVPVIAMDTVQFWKEKYKGCAIAKNHKKFFSLIRNSRGIFGTPFVSSLSDINQKELSVIRAAEQLEVLINEAR